MPLSKPVSSRLDVAERRVGARIDRSQLAVLLLIGGLAALVAVIYRDSYAAMIRIWRSAQYGHGLLVFPVVAYLLWSMRERLGRVELAPCVWALAPLGLLVTAWFVSAGVGLQALEHLSVVLLIPTAILAFLGWPLVRSALFPLLFVLAAVPVGDGLIPHLMELTADVSTALLRAAGVPVFRQGQFLTLPGGDFEIADVCAGLQFLVAGTIIGVLFAYLTYRSNLKRAVFVAVIAATMLAANSLRAFVVMYVASATNMRYLASGHFLFGWVLFGTVVFAVIYVASKFADRNEEPEPPGEAAGAAPARGLPLILVAALLAAAVAAAAVNPTAARGFVLLPAAALLAWAAARGLAAARVEGGRGASARSAYERSGAIATVAAAAGLLGAGPLWLASGVSAKRVSAPTLTLPVVDGCGAAGEWLGDWHPLFDSPDAAASGTYSCPARVNVFVATYVSNTQGHEVVGATNRLVPDAWRRLAAPTRLEFAAADGRRVAVNELQFAAAGAQVLVWYWYATGGETVAGEAAVKLRQALQMLERGRSDGSIYLLETSLDEPIDTSRGRLAGVARDVAELASVPADQERE